MPRSFPSATPTVTPLVAATDIQKRIGTTPVLRGVTMAADEGEAVAVTGPSGSGKSTFLAVLAVLTSWDSGTLELNGTSVPSC
jgi:ABC-type polar amino acid transport system, ATPase component